MEGENLSKKDGILIRRASRVRGDVGSKAESPAIIRPKAEGDAGISNIKGKQHGVDPLSQR